MEPNMDNERDKTKYYQRYVEHDTLSRCKDLQRWRGLRGKATSKLLRSAKWFGAGMIDIGTVIKDVRQWNESVGVPFMKALDSLQGTRREIGSKLHAIDVPLTLR